MKSKYFILSVIVFFLATSTGCSLLSGNQGQVKNTAVSEELSIPPTLYPTTPQTTVQKPAVATKPTEIQQTQPQATKAVMTQPAVQDRKKYFIIVGTYPDQGAALDTFSHLSSLGLTNTAMESRKTNQGQMLHMVRLGPFNNQSEINETKNALNADGLSQLKVVEN